MKAKRADYGSEDQGVAYIPTQFAAAGGTAYAPPGEGSAGGFAPEPPQTAAAALPPPANEPLAYGCLVVGRDTHVNGVLSVPGTLRVEGRIDGEIEATEVVVLSGGVIIGNVTCEAGRIHGTLSGTLRCSEDLVILPNAVVEGEIDYRKDLRVEPGAQLNCTVRYRSDMTPLPRMAPADREDERRTEDYRQQRASLLTRIFGAEK